MDDLKSTLLRQGVSKEWIDQRYQAKIQELKACIPVKLESFSDQVESAIFSLETKSDALSTDLTDLDYMLKLRRGCLYYIGGRPGMGKTALSLHLLQLSQLRENKKKTLFFSLEMSKEQLIQRLISQFGAIDLQDVMNPKRMDRLRYEFYVDAVNRVSTLPILIDDAGAIFKVNRAINAVILGVRAKHFISPFSNIPISDNVAIVFVCNAVNLFSCVSCNITIQFIRWDSSDTRIK